MRCFLFISLKDSKKEKLIRSFSYKIVIFAHNTAVYAGYMSCGFVS